MFQICYLINSEKKINWNSSKNMPNGRFSMNLFCFIEWYAVQPHIWDEKKRNFWLMFDMRMNHSFQFGWWVNKNISHFEILCLKQSKFNEIALHLTKMAICAFYCDFSVRCTIFRKLPTKFGFIWFLHH